MNIRRLVAWAVIDGAITALLVSYAHFIQNWAFEGVALGGSALAAWFYLAAVIYELVQSEKDQIVMLPSRLAESMEVAATQEEGEEKKREPTPAEVEKTSRPYGKDFCHACGAILEEKYKWCPGCGVPLSRETEQEAIAGGTTQLATLDPEELPTMVYDYFNEVEEFMKSQVEPLDARLEGAKASMTKGEISEKRLMDVMRDQQEDVAAMVAKMDQRLSKLQEWKTVLSTRRKWAYEQIQEMKTRKWGVPNDEAEILDRRIDKLGLQMTIADRMMNWQGDIDIGLRLARDELDRKMRDAFLSSIPGRQLVKTEQTKAAENV